MFKHVKLPELDFDLESITTDEGRKYLVPNGEVYKSVTTVLSSYNKQHILEWREAVGEEEANRVSGLAARRGTALHSACEQYLLNEMSSLQMTKMMPNIKHLFRQLKPHFDSNMGEIYALEQALYSDKLKIAGRVDCISFWNGVLSIIDFKTSTKYKLQENILNYFMQCTAYALMFEELTGTPINQLVVAIAVEEESLPQFFVVEKHKYITELIKYI